MLHPENIKGRKLNERPIKAMLCFTCCMILIIGSVAGAEPEAYRTVAIPKREHGYNNFKSQVVRTQVEWEAFTKKYLGKDSKGWNNQKAFVEKISEGKIDFKTEALVLLRHTEGSGSVAITFAKPILKGKKLTCTILRKAPEVGTADMAYYCFALVVKKSAVSEVGCLVQGREKQKGTVLQIAKVEKKK